MKRYVSLKNRIRVLTLSILFALAFLLSPKIERYIDELTSTKTEFDIVSVKKSPSSSPKITKQEINYVPEIISTRELESKIIAEGVDINPFIKYNQNTIGALSVPGTYIYYPICSSEDNKTELERNYSDFHSAHGVIFLDMTNNKNFNDLSTVIYGHNMNDGSMFKDLNKYMKRKGYIDDNSLLFITTKDKITAYKTVSASYVKYNDRTYRQTQFESFEQFTDYYKSIIMDSRIISSEVPTQNNVVELVTCNSGGQYRTVVFFSKIFEISNPIVCKEDIEESIRTQTKRNDNYRDLFSNVIGYQMSNSSNSFSITDKNDTRYFWTPERLSTEDRNKIGSDTKYISGYRDFTYGDIKFSVSIIDGQTCLVTEDGNFQLVMEASLVYLFKENIKVKGEIK